MTLRAPTLLLAGFLTVGQVGVPPRALRPVPSCLHDQAERAEQKTRREQALAFVNALGVAERDSFSKTRAYLPVQSLSGLPQLPAGFDSRLYVSGDGYVVSLKDTSD